jgi:hypothetical protein
MGARKPLVDSLFGRHRLDGNPTQRNGARVGMQKSGQQIHEGCLAGAIGANQAYARARNEINVDRLRNDERAKALAEPAD